MREYYSFKIDFTQLGASTYVFDLGSYFSDLHNLYILDETLAQNFRGFRYLNPHVAPFKNIIVCVHSALRSGLFESVWLTETFFQPPNLDLVSKFFDTAMPEYAGKVIVQPPYAIAALAKTECKNILVIETAGTPGDIPSLCKHFPMVVQARFETAGSTPPTVLSSSLIETLAVTNKYWFRKLWSTQPPLLWSAGSPCPISDKHSRFVAKPIGGDCGEGIIIGTTDKISDNMKDNEVYILEPFIPSLRNGKRYLGRAKFCIYGSAESGYHFKIEQAAWLLAPQHKEIVNNAVATDIVPLTLAELGELTRGIEAMFANFVAKLAHYRTASLSDLLKLETDTTTRSLVMKQLENFELAPMYSAPKNQLTIPPTLKCKVDRKEYCVVVVGASLEQCVVNDTGNKPDKISMGLVNHFVPKINRNSLLPAEVTQLEQVLNRADRVGLIAFTNANVLLLARYFVYELALMLIRQPKDELQLEILYGIARCYFLLGDKKQTLDNAELLRVASDSYASTDKPRAMLYSFYSKRLAISTEKKRACIDSELNAPRPKKIELREWTQPHSESATSSTALRIV